MYSQNKEEFYIKRYFKGFRGRLLDIGAYDGKTYSNSLALLLSGWYGELIEPSPEVYKLLANNMRGLQVKIGNFGIGTKDGTCTFYDNTNAVATTVQKETVKWHKEKFTETTIQVRKFDTIWPDARFDFITIDTEGLDWEILQQIDIDKVGCRCVCIEYNLDKVLLAKYKEYFEEYNMKLVYTSAENVIYVK